MAYETTEADQVKAASRYRVICMHGSKWSYLTTFQPLFVMVLSPLLCRDRCSEIPSHLLYSKDTSYIIHEVKREPPLYILTDNSINTTSCENQREPNMLCSGYDFWQEVIFLPFLIHGLNLTAGIRSEFFVFCPLSPGKDWLMMYLWVDSYTYSIQSGTVLTPLC